MPDVATHTIFVAGSAHLDILAHAVSQERVLDRIGEVSIEVGGTACNIAVNLARMGVGVRFMSAMNQSAYADIVRTYLTENKVETHIEVDARLPTSAFSAHLDEKGELISAITCATVERHTFTEEMFQQRMKGACCAIIDCNLSAESIDAAVSAANSLEIPVFIAAVSEAKTVRFANVADRVNGVFLNRDEIRYLKEQKLSTAVFYEDMSDLLDTTLIITCSESGVFIVDRRQSTHINPPRIEAGAGNLLGMGDMFCAATVKYHVVNNLPLAHAARSATIFTREIAHRTNCNLGRTGTVESLISNLNAAAHLDPLTGINNRRAAEKALESASSLGTGTPYAVILIDIDHFKKINDTHGHPVGDTVLTEVADVLMRSARDTDAVGRWGGEEFIVIMPNVRSSEAMTVAERIRHAVENRETPMCPCTISLGVALAEAGEVFAGVVQRADEALYQAKNTGRNRVCALNTGPVSQRA